MGVKTDAYVIGHEMMLSKEVSKRSKAYEYKEKKKERKEHLMILQRTGTG